MAELNILVTFSFLSWAIDNEHFVILFKTLHTHIYSIYTHITYTLTLTDLYKCVYISLFIKILIFVFQL
jgi:hypothetical protein